MLGILLASVSPAPLASEDLGTFSPVLNSSPNYPNFTPLSTCSFIIDSTKDIP